MGAVRRCAVSAAGGNELRGRGVTRPVKWAQRVRFFQTSAKTAQAAGRGWISIHHRRAPETRLRTYATAKGGKISSARRECGLRFAMGELLQGVAARQAHTAH